MRFPGHFLRNRVFAVLALFLAVLLPQAARAQISSVVLLSASPNPAVQGVQVTFTAGVREVSVVPTGTITFFVDGSLSGTVNLDSTGTATFAISTLSTGYHNIYASYSGDSNYSPATSTSLTEKINTSFVITSTVLHSSQNPSSDGQTITLTANVEYSANTNQNPTGSVTFYDSGVVLGTAQRVVTSGTGSEYSHSASLQIATLSAGAHSIQATYSGDNIYAGSTSAVLSQVVQVSTSPTTTTVTSSLNPSVVGQGVTFTATVVSTATGAPTGTVQFLDGTSVLGTATLNAGGRATFTTSSLAKGTHNIQAAYGGDTNFSASSGTLSPAQQVNAPPLTPTNVGVTSSDSQPAVGESITLTATVTPVSGTETPTGTVSFTITHSDSSSDSLSTVAVDQNGKASVTTSLLRSGTNTITAAYSGDSSFLANSGTLTLVVNPPTNVSTTIKLTSSANPSSYAQAVSFKAAVSGNGGVPSGTVTFTLTYGTTLVATGAGTLDSSGVAIFTTSAVPVGTVSVAAVYSGDAMFAGSTSSLTQTVSQASTTITVISSKNPASFGATVTLTATVSSSSGATATGTVDFKDGTSDIGSAPVDANGTAQLMISTPGVGSHNLVAYYSGDTNFLSSDSSITPLVQVVTQASTTMLASSLNPQLINQPVTLTATVASPVSVTGTVTFKAGTTVLGAATIVGNQASITHTFSVTTNVTAFYSGDTTNQASTSPVFTETIVPRFASTITASASTTSANYRDFVTLVSRVTGATAATGSVLFYNGTSLLGSAVLDANGVAILTRNTLPVGAAALTAKYVGSATLLPSVANATVVINPAPSTVELVSSVNPASAGNVVELVATINSTTGLVATGTVTFSQNGLPLGPPVALSGGRAVFTTNALPTGSHTIDVSYSGGSTLTPSSTQYMQQVN